MSSIAFDIQNHIARITIDRPHVLNALDREAAQELGAVWQRLERERGVRVIVLTGAGERAFCAGADMTEELHGNDIEYWLTDTTGFGGLGLRTTLDIPIIARVNGYALGGGLEMVLACDIAVAAEHAEFGFPEPRLGRVPVGGGVTRMMRNIPHTHAMGLLLTGRRITAAEALQYAIVNEVVPRAQLDSAVNSWVDQVLQCSPAALKAIKQITQLTSHLSLTDAQAMRLPSLVKALQSEDAAEGVRAFRDKRNPAWRDSD